MIYTYDPKAMHHVLVKDQDLYDETSAFIAYAPCARIPIRLNKPDPFTATIVLCLDLAFSL